MIRDKKLQIEDKIISESSPCFIIGEVAQAHDGSLGIVHSYIDSIADAGADAVKFQTHIAEDESTPEEPWRIKFSKQDETRYDYWKRMEFTPYQWKGIKQHCDDRNIIFLSSPFSESAVELLSNLGIKAWKVASGETNNIPLIKKLINTDLPILFSSGLSTIEELGKITSLCKDNNLPHGIFQCTTAYPCPPEKVGLNILQVLKKKFNCPVGLSDHSGEIFSGLGSIPLGANMLEVHVTYHKNMFGPDVKSSLDLNQFRTLIKGVRFIEKILNNPVDKLDLSKTALGLKETFGKSLIAKKEIPANTPLRVDHLSFKKPGTGISVTDYEKYLDKLTIKSIGKNTILKPQDFKL